MARLNFLTLDMRRRRASVRLVAAAMLAAGGAEHAALAAAAEGGQANLLAVERQVPEPHVFISPASHAGGEFRQLLSKLQVGKLQREQHAADVNARVRDYRFDRVERVLRRDVHVGG